MSDLLNLYVKTLRDKLEELNVYCLVNNSGCQCGKEDDFILCGKIRHDCKICFSHVCINCEDRCDSCIDINECRFGAEFHEGCRHNEKCIEEDRPEDMK